MKCAKRHEDNYRPLSATAHLLFLWVFRVPATFYVARRIPHLSSVANFGLVQKSSSQD